MPLGRVLTRQRISDDGGPPFGAEDVPLYIVGSNALLDISAVHSNFGGSI